MRETRLSELFRKYYLRTASDMEEQEFMEMVAEARHNEQLMLLMQTEWEQLSSVNPHFNRDSGQSLLDNIFHLQQDPLHSDIHRIHFFRNWFRYAAAIIIIFGIAAYLWNRQQDKAFEIAKKKPVPALQDVMPGRNRAILTLSDGSAIALDSAAVGQLAMQGTSAIQKTADGQIVYTAGSVAASQPVVYNTMSTPRGGQYSLTLPDGSKVWLNAASSITYPTLFTGNERKVSITGEAYFEVTKNKSRPFIVGTTTDQVMVFGTSFNVNAYNDGRPVKTTLLEGSVKIGDKTLQPGQAFLDGEIIQTNVTQDVAWKNGFFNFHKLGLKEVMIQLERWYDIEVVYEGSIPKMLFYGEMGRDLNLSQVLEGLEGSGVKFRIEQGKRIVVKK